MFCTSLPRARCISDRREQWSGRTTMPAQRRSPRNGSIAIVTDGRIPAVPLFDRAIIKNSPYSSRLVDPQGRAGVDSVFGACRRSSWQGLSRCKTWMLTIILLKASASRASRSVRKGSVDRGTDEQIDRQTRAHRQTDATDRRSLCPGLTWRGMTGEWRAGSGSNGLVDYRGQGEERGWQR